MWENFDQFLSGITETVPATMVAGGAGLYALYGIARRVCRGASPKLSTQQDKLYQHILSCLDKTTWTISGEWLQLADPSDRRNQNYILANKHGFYIQGDNLLDKLPRPCRREIVRSIAKCRKHTEARVKTEALRTAVTIIAPKRVCTEAPQLVVATRNNLGSYSEAYNAVLNRICEAPGMKPDAVSKLIESIAANYELSQDARLKLKTAFAAYLREPTVKTTVSAAAERVAYLWNTNGGAVPGWVTARIPKDATRYSILGILDAAAAQFALKVDEQTHLHNLFAGQLDAADRRQMGKAEEAVRASLKGWTSFSPASVAREVGAAIVNYQLLPSHAEGLKRVFKLYESKVFCATETVRAKAAQWQRTYNTPLSIRAAINSVVQELILDPDQRKQVEAHFAAQLAAEAPRVPVTVPSDATDAAVLKLLNSKKFKWRSVDGIAKVTKLSTTVVSDVLRRYMVSGIVQRHQRNPNLFGFYERVAPTAAAPRNNPVLVAKVKQMIAPKAKAVSASLTTGEVDRLIFGALQGKFKWRTVKGLAKQTKLPEETVSATLTRWHPGHIVVKNKTGCWAYWDRVTVRKFPTDLNLIAAARTLVSGDQATKRQDAEKRLFVALAKSEKFLWRSAKGLAKDAKLTTEEAMDILNRYLPSGIVVRNRRNLDQFGYYARVRPNAQVSIPVAAQVAGYIA